jgi:hypothetical protein
MNIKQAIENKFKATSGLTSLVGTNIYWREFPQGVKKKALCINKLSGPRETAMVADPGIVYGRFQFTAMGTTEKEPDDILVQVAVALQNFTGVMGTVGANTGVQVDYTEYIGENEILFNTSNDDVQIKGIFLNAADWYIYYHE